MFLLPPPVSSLQIDSDVLQTFDNEKCHACPRPAPPLPPFAGAVAFSTAATLFFCRSPISSRGGGEFSAALPPSQATECLLLHIVSCLTFAKEKKSFLHSVEDRQEKGIKRGDGETGGEGRGKKTDAHRILDSARSLCVFRCLGWRERGLIYERAAGVDIALVYARPDHNSVYVKRS